MNFVLKSCSINNRGFERRGVSVEEVALGCGARVVGSLAFEPRAELVFLLLDPVDVALLDFDPFDVDPKSILEPFITGIAQCASSGKEKNAKKGQMYRSCAKWTVATWLDLSPDDLSANCPNVFHLITYPVQLHRSTKQRLQRQVGPRCMARFAAVVGSDCTAQRCLSSLL